MLFYPTDKYGNQTRTIKLVMKNPIIETCKKSWGHREGGHQLQLSRKSSWRKPDGKVGATSKDPSTSGYTP